MLVFIYRGCNLTQTLIQNPHSKAHVDSCLEILIKWSNCHSLVLVVNTYVLEIFLRKEKSSRLKKWIHWKQEVDRKGFIAKIINKVMANSDLDV